MMKTLMTLAACVPLVATPVLAGPIDAKPKPAWKSVETRIETPIETRIETTVKTKKPADPAQSYDPFTKAPDLANGLAGQEIVTGKVKLPGLVL